MALSMGGPINWDEIESVQVLRPGTVYLLNGFQGDNLVCKSEAANLSKDSFNITRSAMRKVDAVAGDTKAMTDAEKRDLKRFAEAMKQIVAVMVENRIPGWATSPAYDDVIQNFAQNPHALWYKMPLQDLKDLKDALTKRMGAVADKGPIQAFTTALSAPGGLEALGRIIACDLFVGNTDRINPAEGSNMTFGGRMFNFQVIKNIGNIFIAGSGVARTVTGMDFIDPSTGYRHYDQTLQEVKDNYNEEWIGEWLVDRRLREAFCKSIVDDLEMVLTPNRKRYSPYTKLGRDAWKRINRGMVAGATLLLTGLEDKYKIKAAPAGMASRLAKLRLVA